jgi:hypothetical protein
MEVQAFLEAQVGLLLVRVAVEQGQLVETHQAHRAEQAEQERPLLFQGFL